MSSYPAKRLVNKYWKRPKPKIYDCNIRDAERIYKDSYNQYLKSKHFYASHGSDPSDIEEQFATRWTLHRMRNALDTVNDPLTRRDGSALSAMDYGVTNGDGGYSRPSYTRHDSLTENNIERPTGRARSMVQSLRDPSPEIQLENIESRLERIKKLRQELDMDSNEDDRAGKMSRRPPRGMSPTDSRNTVNESQNSYSYKSSRQAGREPSSDIYESKYSQRTERSSRMRDVDNDSSLGGYRNRQQEENKYSFKSNIASKHEEEDKYAPRSSRLANRFGDEDKTSKRSKLGVTFENDDKYSTKSYKTSSKYEDEDKYSKGSRFSKYDNDDSGSFASQRTRKAYDSEESSYSSRPKNDFSSETKPRRSRKVEDTDDITNPDEEDEIVSNIRKKFPTSDEILQKISKYDIE